MVWEYLLYSLFWACTVTALGIPRHGKQQPLVLGQQQTRYEVQSASVTLVFTQSGGNMEQQVKIPLDKRIFSSMPPGTGVHSSGLEKKEIR